MDSDSSQIIVLDRDGVINKDRDDFIKSPDEWEALPGSLEAIARLNAAGFRVVIATNQSGIERGLLNTETLIAIHAKMFQELSRAGGRIDAIFFCPHTADSECECRKPKPGMFYAIEERFHTSLHNAPCVGDSLRDLQAGVAVGAAPILVKTGKGAKTLKEGNLPVGTQVFDDLAAVADKLVLKG
jgi:D-glycero-D-manno-heptose 1,7-bisphosphate phosphatase